MPETSYAYTRHPSIGALTLITGSPFAVTAQTVPLQLAVITRPFYRTPNSAAAARAEDDQVSAARGSLTGRRP